MENLPKNPAATTTAINFFDKEQFEVVQRVCKLLASSELVPDIYKESPNNPQAKAVANCLIALEMSTRIGASPLMVMQNMAIVYGRPTWSSSFLIATVNSCGRYNSLKYRFTEKGMLGMVDYTDYEYNPTTRRKEAVTKQFDGRKIMDVECVAYTTEKGDDQVLESSPISIRLAIQEGWYTKAGSKWKTMTRQMLMYRAAAFWQRAYAPELSMGMKTVEETEDIVDVEFEDATTEIEKKANKKTISMDAASLANSANVADVIAKEAAAEKEQASAAATVNEPVKKPEEKRFDPGF